MAEEPSSRALKGEKKFSRWTRKEKIFQAQVANSQRPSSFRVWRKWPLCNDLF